MLKSQRMQILILNLKKNKMKTITQNNLTIGFNSSISSEYLTVQEVMNQSEGQYDKLLLAIKKGKMEPVSVNGLNMFRLSDVQAFKELK